MQLIAEPKKIAFVGSTGFSSFRHEAVALDDLFCPCLEEVIGTQL
jgi:hypothetical protein